MRTILYSTEKVSANNIETFFFIGFLLFWAIAASGYVLYFGLAVGSREGGERMVLGPGTRGGDHAPQRVMHHGP